MRVRLKSTDGEVRTSSVAYCSHHKFDKIDADSQVTILAIDFLGDFVMSAVTFSNKDSFLYQSKTFASQSGKVALQDAMHLLLWTDADGS